MIEFLLARLARTVLTLIVLISVVFFAIRLSGHPIDYIMPEGLDAEGRAAMIRYWGLDQPVLDQFVLFWRALLQGEFGLGLVERRPVAEIFSDRVVRSLSLLVSVLFVTITIGVPLGVAAALRRGSMVGSTILLSAFLGYSIPNFVLSILLLLIFSYSLHWLPSAGSSSLAHFVMPTLALSAFFTASLVRYTRNAMLDVLGQDYMRTARAKGLSERVVVFKHGLRNALIPVVTVLGLQITSLVGGAVVVETVFAWNGVGDLLVAATLRRDYPVLQFGVMGIAVVVVTVNFLIDLAYSAIDPRVRLGAAAGGGA
jgi:glutathione transport system permease protein